MSARHSGFGLVELVVALTILSVALLGLAGAAAVAHRSFMGAEALDQATDAAAMVLDSLMREDAPVAGERRTGRALLRWSVRVDSAGTAIALTVAVPDGAKTRQLSFNAIHHAR